MRRRQVLATATALFGGALTAGCTGSGTGQYTPTTSDGTTTERPDAYRIENYEQSVDRLGPRGTYVIDTTRWRKWEIPDDASVKRVEAIEEGPAKELIRETILDETTGMDERPPERAIDLVERYDYFHLPRENLPFPYYRLRLYHLDGGTPELSFEATPSERTLTHDDPVEFEYELTNPSDRPREIHAGPIPPFGVQRGTRDDRWQVLLWRDGYESSTHVFVHEHYVETRAEDNRVVVEPGETLAKTYLLRTGRADFGPGHFEIDGRLKHGMVGRGPDVFLDYALSFDLVPR